MTWFAVLLLSVLLVLRVVSLNMQVQTPGWAASLRMGPRPNKIEVRSKGIFSTLGQLLCLKSTKIHAVSQRIGGTVVG